MTGLTCTGCTCGHCGQPIIIFLSCILGVKAIEPHFEQQTVIIEYDEEIMALDQLLEKITHRGYDIEIV